MNTPNFIRHYREVCEFGTVHRQCPCLVPLADKLELRIACPTPNECRRKSDLPHYGHDDDPQR
jgi:hypothetical protein